MVSLDAVVSKYNEALVKIAKRIGGQQASELDVSYINDVFRFAVERIEGCEPGAHKLFSINDNAIVSQLDFYNRAFNRPKLIAIFRHPLAVASSSWFHNHRLAEVENDPSHLAQIRKFGDINGWSIEIAKYVTYHMQKCLKFQTENPNLLIISYESLVDRKAETLDVIFDFLDQDRGASVIEDIVAQTSFEKMKAAASEPGFFRSGQKSAFNSEITTDTKAEVDRICGSVLARVGIA